MNSPLTHFDPQGQAHMVDVAGKAVTHRVATATGTIRMQPSTLALIAQGQARKGDVIGVARIAAIQGAKRTADLVPLATSAVHCQATVETLGRTGVEMEALTAVQVGLLTIYDMCKAAEKGMVITDVRLLEKLGGKSGTWRAEGADPSPSPA